MTKKAELVVEDLPLGSTAQDLAHDIYRARYKSDLHAIGGVALFEKFSDGKITLGDYEALADEIKAKNKLLSAPQDTPPEEVPESPQSQAVPGTSEWTPSQSLTSSEPRVYDWAERAAGEAVIRRED